MVGQYLIRYHYAHVVCKGRLNTDLGDVPFKLRDIGRRTTHRSVPHFNSVRTAILAVVKFKLLFIDCSGSYHSAFYLCRATSAGLSSNPLLHACISMKGVRLMYCKVHTLQ